MAPAAPQNFGSDHQPVEVVDCDDDDDDEPPPPLLLPVSVFLVCSLKTRRLPPLVAVRCCAVVFRTITIVIVVGGPVRIDRLEDEIDKNVPFPY